MEAVLARLLPAAQVVPARLHDAMRYATLEGGKRVRPLLVFAAGEVTQARAERLEVAAAAVELIHAYSLVHDDLPCMDDDVLRRGKPTVHVEYDEATALLVGRRAAVSRLPAARRACARRRCARAAGDGEAARGRGGLARHGRRTADRPRVGRQAAQRARAGGHAHPQDRGADPRCRAAWRRLRRHARCRAARAPGPVRQDRRARLPGGGRRARPRGEHRDAGQDGGQGLAPGQADLRLGDGPRPRARADAGTQARCAPGGRAAGRRARAGCASSPISSS